MNLLSILSADNRSSVSVMINNKSLETLYTNESRSHSKVLPVYIKELIDKYNLIKIDGIAVSIGPGSYTGLRIGLSLAKGIAFSKEIPLIPISTFDIVNYNINNQNDYSILIHSHRNYYFRQEYKDAEKVGKAEVLDINDIENTTIYYTGNEKYQNAQSQHIKLQLDSETMLKIGLEHFDSMIVEDINSVTPLYVSKIPLNNND